MRLTDNKLYLEDLEKVKELNLPWEKLTGKTVMLSGATGLVGSFLVDLIMYMNKHLNLGTRVIALGRSK
nr:SDR family NAD-dependent epimerase/dehydratase [Butyrivibrio sp.]